MAAIKSKYKRFNGVAWEEYYFETSVDQVIGLVDFIKDNETKLSTNDSTATSGKYISRIQVSDHGLTITKEDLPTGFSGDYNDLTNKPEIPQGTVTSVNGKEGVVVLTQDDVADGSTYKRVTNTEKTTWNNKVDKIAGKGLSTEDYTTAEKNKLDGIQAGAQVNTVTSVAGKTGAVTLVADDIPFDGSSTNYLVSKTDVESAVKELDLRVKANADYDDSKFTDYVLTAPGIFADGLNHMNDIDLQNVSDTFHPEDIITVSNIKIGHNIRLCINRPDGGYTEYGVATIIGLNEDEETGIDIIVKKFSGSLLNSQPQFLAIGTIIKHPDYPNNIYVNTVAGHFRLSNFEAALNANVIRPLLTDSDLDAHNIRFNGSGTNYLVSKTDVESAIKELDTQIKDVNDDKLDKNTNITGATKTKITYDSKGLVTGGEDLVESDIPALAISKITNLQTELDGKQPLDADLTSIAALSGTSGLLRKTEANTWELDNTSYEFTSNKKTTWGTPTNTDYPSSKLVKDSLDGKEPTITASTNPAHYYSGDKTWKTLPTAPATNLGTTYTGTSVTITSSTGSNATINAASTIDAGVVTTGAQTFKGNKTFSDDIVISGDLTVQGENFIANTTTLTTEDDVIELRSSGTTAITTPAGIVIKKYDGTNDGGIVIKNDGEVRVGKVEVGVNGAITNSADAQPVLTRDERSNLTTNRILMWSGSNKATNLGVGSAGQFLNHLHQWATPVGTVYDLMTDTVLGLGKVFSNTTQTVAANSVSSTASRTYGIQKNSSGQLVVNVPWSDTNTIYTHPTYAGDDINLDTGTLTGATVVSRVDINVTTDTLGHVTDANGLVTTRTLTLADLGYVAPTINNGQLTLATSGVGLSGSGTFTANQSGNSTFTVTSNATDQPTASTIVARDSSGDVRAASKFYYSSNAYTTYNSTDKSIDFVFTN